MCFLVELCEPVELAWAEPLEVELAHCCVVDDLRIYATPRVRGGSASTAYDAVQRAAQMIPTEGAAEMKQAMLDEMDRMTRHLWGIVEREEPDHGQGLRAISQLLRVQERKARLVGLDAPTRRAIDMITHDAFMEAIGNLEREVAELERQGAEG